MVKINDLSNEIAKALKEYTDEVTEGLEKAKEEVAKDTVSHLKGLSHPKLTGDYAKGWASLKAGNSLIVYNRTNYQITHLLEKGHAKVNGGRVAAIPHIGPAEDKAIDEFIVKVERVIKG